MTELPPYWQKDVQASSLTSMACGGTVAYLAQPKTVDALLKTYTLAATYGLPVKILGGGSNLIFSDSGFSGVVIRPQFRQLQLIANDSWHDQLEQLSNEQTITHRYQAAKPGYLSLKEQEPEISGPLTLIEAGCDVAWGQLVQFSLRNQLHGLHRYARIPCKVGGAVYNNIHAAEHLLNEMLCAVEVLEPKTGTVRWYSSKELDFGYDTSQFQHTDEVILTVLFALPAVSAERSRLNSLQFRDWTAQKALVQPSGPNSGSVFKNLTPAVAATVGEKQLAAGYYVEACGYKGYTIGGMQVYSRHANFIVNVAAGTQDDLLALIAEIREAVSNRFKIWLEPEVECIDQLGRPYVWEKNSFV